MGGGLRVEGLGKREKGLVDIDNRVVIVGYKRLYVGNKGMYGV